MHLRSAKRGWSLLLIVGLLGMTALGFQTSFAHPVPARTEGTPTMTTMTLSPTETATMEADPSPSLVVSMGTATASPIDPSPVPQTTQAQVHTITLTETRRNQTIFAQKGDTIVVQLPSPGSEAFWTDLTSSNDAILSPQDTQRKPDGSVSAVFLAVSPGFASITSQLRCQEGGLPPFCPDKSTFVSATVYIH